MRHTAIAFLFTLMLACVPTTIPHASDDKPLNEKPWEADPARGERLAETLCAGCHVVNPDQTTSAIVGVPTFRAIANLKGRTSQHITNTLIRPHPEMPNAQLTQHEIGDLLAYFDTLRKPAEQNEAPPGPKLPPT